MKTLKLYFAFIFLAIFASCVPNESDLQQPETGETPLDAVKTLENLSIPSDFNFETERDVTLVINDATSYVSYEIFAYSENSSSEAENISEALNNLLFAGKLYNGELNQVFSLSSVYNKVYLLRKEGLEYTSQILTVLNNQIDFKFANKSANKSTGTSKTSSTGCTDCTANFFLNGSFENGPELPNNKPISPKEQDVEGWSTTASNNKIELWKSGNNGVSSQNGSYFTALNAKKNTAVYQRICTSPGAEITWSVWHRGGQGTDVSVVRIGQYLATATTEATMTTNNSAWVQYRGTYTVPAGQEDTYFMFEAVSSHDNDKNDGNFIDNVVITETVPGTCATITSKMFYPTEFTKANIAFEDQWPYTGDYDFNDLVMNYNIVTTLNAQNKVTQIDYNYTVESIGGSYRNGFGIELEGVLPSAIASVSGSNLTEGIITNNANGTEQSQPNAVIVFFDNGHVNEGLSNTISIIFTNPITTASLGTAPFNPFLIINKNRLKEIHLPTKPATYFPTTTNIVTSPTVKDSDGDFKTTTGLPWAINIAGNYKAPKEKITITEGYNFFSNWASSGGKNKLDWHEDKTGYRNKDKLKN